MLTKELKNTTVGKIWKEEGEYKQLKIYAEDTAFGILRFSVDIWHLFQTFSKDTIAWFWFRVTGEGLLPETIV